MRIRLSKRNLTMVVVIIINRGNFNMTIDVKEISDYAGNTCYFSVYNIQVIVHVEKFICITEAYIVPFLFCINVMQTVNVEALR